MARVYPTGNDSSGHHTHWLIRPSKPGRSHCCLPTPQHMSLQLIHMQGGPSKTLGRGD